jgi:hypothetical protein
MRHVTCFAFTIAVCCCSCSRPMGAPTAPVATSTGAPQIAPAPAERAGGAAAQEQADKAGRKIKFNADVRLIADDFDAAERSLKAAIKEAEGFAAMSEVTGAAGSRQGLWRVRLPVPRFDPFREAVLQLGEVERNTSDSEDMTDEYYDLQAHIKNRQAEEESLRQLMEKSATSMENLLAIRREMNQLRDDINRKQGRLKLLAHLTDLATVTVAIRERQRYNREPAPQVAEVPTFGVRAQHTFNQSWQALQSLGQALLLCLIAAAPWLPVPLLGAAAARWWWRRAHLGAAPAAPPQASS